MDLSGLKWPLIIVIVVAIGWLMSSGGVNYMYGNFTKATPGEDVERDKVDEAGLTKLGGYLMLLWRWEKARNVMEESVRRYGDSGANFWYNKYRLAKCYDRLEKYKVSYSILQFLISNNAHEYDERVANNDNLSLRAAKLKEVYEIQ